MYYCFSSVTKSSKSFLLTSIFYLKSIHHLEYNKHSIEAIKDGMSQILKGNPQAHASIVINKYEHSRTEGYGYKYGKY